MTSPVFDPKANKAINGPKTKRKPKPKPFGKKKKSGPSIPKGEKFTPYR